MQRRPGLFIGAMLALAIMFAASADKETTPPPRVPQHMLDATLKVRAGVIIPPLPWIENGRPTAGWQYGSGVMASESEMITAAHVIYSRGEICKNIEVEVRGEHASRVWVDAKVLSSDKTLDIAVLRLDVKVRKWAELDLASGVGPGDAVWVVGCPSALAPVATLGWVAAYQDSSGMLSPYWLSGNCIYFGNSGGPVFDANSGKVVGTLLAGTGAPNVSLWVPLSLSRFLIQAEIKSLPRLNKK